jgi:Family of unknown function (DUF6286)
MHTVNRVLAAVLGLFLLVGGLLTAVEIAIAFVGGDRWILPYDAWYRHARADAWDSGGVRGLLVVIAAIGVGHVVLQLVRRAPLTLPLSSETDATYAVRRRSLQRSLVRSTEAVDGVESAKARIDQRGVRVRARSNRRLPGEMKSVVEAVVTGRLQQLELESIPRVRVSLRVRDGRS